MSETSRYTLDPIEDITIGLALSGGTAKSIAHIGVLKAFEEAGVVIDCLTGTSGGAIVGAMYAAGKSIEDLEHVAANLRWKHLARLTLPRLGIMNNSRMEHFINNLLGEVTFADLKIPFAVVATDLLTGDRVVIKEGSVAKAVMKSSSIPNVFEPIEDNGTMYVDGGLTEYLPVETLRESFHPDIAIGVSLGQRHVQAVKPRHLLHVAMAVTTIAARATVQRSEALADLVIKPPAGRFPSYDLKAGAELMDVGHQAARARMPEILELLEPGEKPWLDRLRFWSKKA